MAVPLSPTRPPCYYATRDAAQKELEQSYPQLFTSNEEIAEYKKQQRKAAQDDPKFKQLLDERAAAYRAQQDYLFEHDGELARLQALIEKE